MSCLKNYSLNVQIIIFRVKGYANDNKADYLKLHIKLIIQWLQSTFDARTGATID